MLLRGPTDAGFRATAPVWHDPAVDWAASDLLVIRSPWDCPERYAEFMGWLDRVAGQTRILNAPDLIRWNIDKRYLDDFGTRGVPCVPFAFCATPADPQLIEVEIFEPSYFTDVIPEATDLFVAAVQRRLVPPGE